MFVVGKTNAFGLDGKGTNGNEEFDDNARKRQAFIKTRSSGKELELLCLVQSEMTDFLPTYPMVTCEAWSLIRSEFVGHCQS